MAWVDAADMMYSTGLEQYPDSVFLHIAYANFLSTYKKGSGVRLPVQPQLQDLLAISHTQAAGSCTLHKMIKGCQQLPYVIELSEAQKVC